MDFIRINRRQKLIVAFYCSVFFFIRIADRNLQDGFFIFGQICFKSLLIPYYFVTAAAVDVVKC